MALRIAKDAGLTNVVSIDGAQTNPITSQHPIAGSTVEQKLFLFNNDSTKRYEGITIDPTDATAPDDSGMIYLAPDNAGVAGTYLAASAALTMANVSDSNAGKAFWVKVVAPAVATTQNKTDIKLTINFTEFAV